MLGQAERVSVGCLGYVGIVHRLSLWWSAVWPPAQTHKLNVWRRTGSLPLLSCTHPLPRFFYWKALKSAPKLFCIRQYRNKARVFSWWPSWNSPKWAKLKVRGWREWLRAGITPSEDPSSVPRAYIGLFTTSGNSSSWDLMPSSGILGLRTHAHIPIHRYIGIHIIKNKKCKWITMSVLVIYILIMVQLGW